MYYIFSWITTLLKFLMLDFIYLIILFKLYNPKRTWYHWLEKGKVISSSCITQDCIFYENKYYALFQVKRKGYVGYGNCMTGHKEYEKPPKEIIVLERFKPKEKATVLECLKIK